MSLNVFIIALKYRHYPDSDQPMWPWTLTQLSDWAPNGSWSWSTGTFNHGNELSMTWAKVLAVV